MKQNFVTTWARRVPALWMLGLFAAAPAFGQTIPYFTDFESGIGPEWSTNTLDGTQPYYFTTFSGRFGNTNQNLTVTGLATGISYTVGFDLHVIDSWDGGGDVFGVWINNILRLQESFANSVAQTNPRVPDEGRAHFGFTATSTSFVDAIYRNIEVVFTATTDVAQISFRGQGLEALTIDLRTSNATG